MIRCPFGMCSAVVDLIPTLPRDTIKTHELKGPPRLPVVNCPASLMGLPMTDAEHEALIEQYRDLAAQVARDAAPPVRTPAQQKGVDNLLNLVDHLGGDQEQIDEKIKKAYYRGPEPGDPAWQVGGRADEDVVPQGEVRTGIIPLGVRGQSIGRGSDMSMAEMIGAIRSGVNATEVAIASCGGVRHEVERARDIVGSVLGDSQSESLENMMANFNQVLEDIREVESALAQAKEQGENYMQRMQG